MNLTLYTTKAFFILDAANGSRVLAKYYTNAHQEYPTVKEQRQLEKSLWDKTKKLLNNEILLFENQVVVYRASVDVIFYLVGSAEENEVMLTTVLQVIYDSLGLILPYVASPNSTSVPILTRQHSNNQVEKRNLIGSMDLTALTLDQCIDNGIIIETDPATVASRVSKKSADMVDLTIGDQSIGDAFNKAKEQFLNDMQSLDFSIVHAGGQTGQPLGSRSGTPSAGDYSFASSTAALSERGGNTRSGWCSNRYVDYPQTFTLRVHRQEHDLLPRARILQLLVHNYKIAGKIELWYNVNPAQPSPAAIADAVEDRIVLFVKAGQVCLATNEEREYRARELKSVSLSADYDVEYIRVVVHAPHRNPFNLHAQAAFVDIKLLGDGQLNGAAQSWPVSSIKRPPSVVADAVAAVRSIHALRLSELRSLQASRASPTPDALARSHVRSASSSPPLLAVAPAASPHTAPANTSLANATNGSSVVDRADVTVTSTAPTPTPEELGAVSSQYEPVLAAFGQDTTTLFASRSFSNKERAMTDIAEQVQQLLREGTADTERATAVVKGIAILIHLSLPDVREKVLGWVFLQWHAMLDIAQAFDVPPPAYFHTLNAQVPVLLVKCGDVNARIRNPARDLLLRLTITFHQTYSILPHLFKSRKGRVLWRQLEARLVVVKQALGTVGIRGYALGDKSDGALDLAQTRHLVMSSVVNTNASVRDAATQCLVQVARIVGRRKVDQWLEGIVQQVLVETIKRKLSNAFDKEKDANGSRTRRLTSSSGIRAPTKATAIRSTRSVPNLRQLASAPTPARPSRPSVTKPPKPSPVIPPTPVADPTGVVGQAAREDNADEYDEKTCIFCDRHDERFDENALEHHYRETCPMLHECAHCHTIVEVAAYQRHVLEECNFANARLCEQCGALLDSNTRHDCTGHTAAATVRCPLCKVVVSSDSIDDTDAEAALRQHMTRPAGGCPRAEPKRRP
ncbi:Golgi-to-ER vesicle coat component [Sorochytrium milnesiophthora]